MSKEISDKQVSGVSHAKAESMAIYAALLSGAMGFVISFLLFQGGTTALFTRGVSIGFVASILATITSLITYLFVDKMLADRANIKRQFGSYIGVWSLAVVHSLLVLLVYALFFYVISQSFIGAEIDTIGASTIVSLVIGLAGYISYLSAISMSSMRVAVLLALFLISGTFISMLSASDPNWWYLHFSSLGADSGVSSYAFNGTLIIAGLAMVGLTKHIINDFRKLKQEKGLAKRTKVGILAFGITGIGIMLALVGSFVYNVFPTVHNLAAGGMAFCFLAIILILPLLTPDFPKTFFLASYSLFAGLLLSVWLYLSVGYFNLTVFELIAAAIIFTWLIVFVRYTSAMLADRDRSADEAIQ